MKTRMLGNELEVSAVALGCMGLTHAYGTAVPDKEAIALIQAAVEQGYTYFDTAECYIGNYEDGSIAYNESVVGKALREVRNRVVIASKFGVHHEGTKLVVNSSPDMIRKSVEGSLNRLGVDTIDLYYQHRIDPKVEPEEVAETMKDLMKEGKIRYWGISETTEDYLRRANAVCKVTAIQNRYSMMARWNEALFPTLEELGIGFVAFSPLANGILTNAYSEGSTFDKGDFRNDMPQYKVDAYEKNLKLHSLLEILAKEKQATPAQISLAWMLAKKPYIVPIPGSRKIERVKENAGAAEITFTKKEIDTLNMTLEQIPMSDVFGGHKIEA